MLNTCSILRFYFTFEFDKKLILNRKFTPYIYIIFICFFSIEYYSQEFTLKITSTKKNEIEVFNNLNFKKKFKDSLNIFLEVNKISNHLKNIGYFTNTLDSIKKVNKSYTAFFSLNLKVNSATIRFKNQKLIKESLNLKDDFINLKIYEVKDFLKNISNILDLEGKSFSKVQLKNITIKKNKLSADLFINNSNKRTIDKVVIKGYEDFPKSFLKNYFHLKNSTIFSKSKLNEISNLSKNLKFVKEIKPPETLFLKDSTLLYIYLKKQKNSSFDGLANFTTKENGNLLFNGHLNLELNNVLNTGENFKLFWNSIGNEKQEFNVSTEIPFIFNSVITPQIVFSIYKQDSTFLNTKFDTKFFYNLSQKSKLALTFNSESSNNLISTNNNNIKSFKNFFSGIEFQYRKTKGDFFYNDIFLLKINPTLGIRSSENTRSNQFKFESTISYLWDLNTKSSIYIQNKIGYLNSNNLFNNELFRIGGANSIRGFNEQSIFTNNYKYFNIEYRFLTTNKSYIYSITDIGNISNNQNLLGLGLGYLFTSNNSQINISSAIGKFSSQRFDFKESKIIISWKNFF